MRETGKSRKPSPPRTRKARHFEDLLRNPVKLLTSEEVAMALEVSLSWVAALKKAGAPFPGGRTRPEWLFEWLHENPKFSLKQHRD